MLTIRLFRVGRKNQPSFKIVVTDKRNAASRGRFVEEVGFYDPLTKQRNLKGDRVKYWISMGAKPSDTIYNMLIAEKVLEGAKIPKHKKSKKAAQQPQPTQPQETQAVTAIPAGEAAQTPQPEAAAPQVPEAPAKGPEKAQEALQEADSPIEKAEQPDAAKGDS